MVSTFTTNRHFEKPAHNDDIDTWDVPVNANSTAMDSAFGGVTSINVTAASGVITLSNSTGSPPSYICPIFKLAGVLTANVNYQFPSGIGGNYAIFNSTSGAFSVTFSSAGGGSTVAVTQGTSVLIAVDGTNVLLANTANTLASVTGTGAVVLANNPTITSLTASGISTFTGDAYVVNNLSVAGAALGGASLAVGGTLRVDGASTFNHTISIAGGGGVTSQSDILCTNGSIHSGNDVSATNFGQVATLQGIQLLITAGGGAVQFDIGPRINGVRLSDGATSWTSASSISYKRDIQPIADGAVGRIRKMPKILYRYKSDADDAPLRPGTLYEEALEVLPYVTTYTPERKSEKGGVLPERKGLSLEQIVPDLMKAIDELSDEIAALKASRA